MSTQVDGIIQIEFNGDWNLIEGEGKGILMFDNDWVLYKNIQLLVFM